MKSFYHYLSILFILVITAACGNGSSNNSSRKQPMPSESSIRQDSDEKQDPFFEGIFKPGVLTAEYIEDSYNTHTVQQTLTIRKDRTFVMREKTTYHYDGNVEIHTYEGRIKDKYTENYNGTNHTWYVLEGEAGNMVGNWSIEKDGTAVGGFHRTYQGIYSRLNDNRSQGWYWKMTRSQDSDSYGQKTTKTSNPTKTVFTYDGGKIILQDDPPIANVNGISGNWSYVPDKGRRNWPPQPYYFVYYGNNQTMIISEGKGMLYFGTEDEAVRDENVISKWHEYRKSRE